MAEHNQVETALLTQINEVLSNFEEYWDDDTLLKNKVIFHPFLLNPISF